MAISDFFKDARKVILRDSKRGNDLLTFDASVKETHVFQSKISEYPLEEGPDATDNSKVSPQKLTLQIVQSTVPLTLRSVGNKSDPNKTATKGMTRWQEALETLKDIKDGAILLEIVTTLRTYRSMLIESIEVPRDAKTSDGLFATIVFKEVIVASAVVVGEEKEKASGKSKNLGSKPVEKVAEAEAKEPTTLYKAGEFVKTKLFGGP